MARVRYTKKAIWQFGKIGVLVNFIIQELKFCNFFCLSISRERKIWGNERISFSENPNLGVLFGGPLPPREGGLLDVGDDALGLPSRLGVDGAVLTSIGLFTTTDWDLPLMDEALEDEGLLHIDEKKRIYISKHGIPNSFSLSIITVVVIRKTRTSLGVLKSNYLHFYQFSWFFPGPTCLFGMHVYSDFRNIDYPVRSYKYLKKKIIMWALTIAKCVL